MTIMYTYKGQEITDNHMKSHIKQAKIKYNPLNIFNSHAFFDDINYDGKVSMEKIQKILPASDNILPIRLSLQVTPLNNDNGHDLYTNGNCYIKMLNTK